jgi:hypothetical protein
VVSGASGEGFGAQVTSAAEVSNIRSLAICVFTFTFYDPAEDRLWAIYSVSYYQTNVTPAKAKRIG